MVLSMPSSAGEYYTNRDSGSDENNLNGDLFDDSYRRRVFIDRVLVLRVCQHFLHGGKLGMFEHYQ